MNVQLSTSAGINSLVDVEAFVQAEAAHWLALFMPHLSSIHLVVETILTCQQRETAVLLEGPGETAVYVALVTQPELIADSPEPYGNRALSMVHYDMTRTRAWFAAKT